MKAIVELALTKIRDNLQEKGIGLTVTENAKEQIVQHSYNPQYGARPMRRYLKDNLESQIATLILEQNVARRDVIILNDDLSLTVKKAQTL